MVKALLAVDARCIVVMKSRVPLVRVSRPEMDGCFFFPPIRKSRDVVAPRAVTCTLRFWYRWPTACKMPPFSFSVHFTVRASTVKSDWMRATSNVSSFHRVLVRNLFSIYIWNIDSVSIRQTHVSRIESYRFCICYSLDVWRNKIDGVIKKLHNKISEREVNSS